MADTSPDLAESLLKRCQGLAPSASVEVEVHELRAAAAQMSELQGTQRQLEQLQEQLTLKPSLAKKLNERIKSLQTELEVTRNESTVKDLQRKVAKLELELKQSYATKNFTLKSGLLDIEKKHRTAIYGTQDMEELWHDVMLLMVEDKEQLPPGMQQRQAARLQAAQSRQALEALVVSSTVVNANGLQEAGGSERVHRTVEKIQEAHGRDVAPLPLNFPTHSISNGHTAHHHSRTPSSSTAALNASLNASVGSESAHNAEQVQDSVAASLQALRALFMGGRAVFPLEAQATSPRQSAANGPLQVEEVEDLQGGLDALHASMERLMALWNQPGSSLAQAGLGATKPGNPQHQGAPDASYMDSQAEAALASIQHLRALFNKQQVEARVLTSRQPGYVPGRESSPSMSRSASFQKQMDTLAASVLQLRGLWSHANLLPPPPSNVLAAEAIPGDSAIETSTAVSTTPTPRVAFEVPEAGAWGAPAGMARLRTGSAPGFASKAQPGDMAFSAGGGTTPRAAGITGLRAHAPDWWPAALAAAVAHGDTAVIDPQVSHTSNDQQGTPGHFTVTTITSHDLQTPQQPVSSQLNSEGGQSGGHPGSGGSIARHHAARSSPGADGLQLLLLPGPSRTMQAVAAHVRARHAKFLAQCPEAEALLVEALAAAAELQAAQDSALLGSAVRRAGGGSRGHATPVITSPSDNTQTHGDSFTIPYPSLEESGSAPKQPPGTSTSPVLGRDNSEGGAQGQGLDGQAQHVSADLSSAESPSVGQGTTSDQAVEGEQAKAQVAPAELCVQGDSGNSQEFGLVDRNALASPSSEIEPAEDQPDAAELAAVAAAAKSSAFNTGPAAFLEEEHGMEVTELRLIAARHAEHAAALGELLARLAGQHEAAVTRADDLDMQLSLTDKEAGLLRSEVNSMTRLLVDVKMAHAERDSEAMRLEQRLKRSLAGEEIARDAVEELRRQLAVIAPDQVLMDPDFSSTMQEALAGAEVSINISPSFSTRTASMSTRTSSGITGKPSLLPTGSTTGGQQGPKGGRRTGSGSGAGPVQA